MELLEEETLHMLQSIIPEAEESWGLYTTIEEEITTLGSIQSSLNVWVQVLGLWFMALEV